MAEPTGGWVLLVDDHEDSRELLAEYLSMNGFVVESCRSGEMALELIAERGAPGVVVTDITLEGMTGIDLATKLRQVPGAAATPIFAVTGHAEFVDTSGLFSEVLVKPVVLANLSAALRRALGTS